MLTGGVCAVAADSVTVDSSRVVRCWNVIGAFLKRSSVSVAVVGITSVISGNGVVVIVVVVGDGGRMGAVVVSSPEVVAVSRLSATGFHVVVFDVVVGTVAGDDDIAVVKSSNVVGTLRSFVVVIVGGVFGGGGNDGVIVVGDGDVTIVAVAVDVVGIAMVDVDETVVGNATLLVSGRLDSVVKGATDDDLVALVIGSADDSCDVVSIVLAD